MNDRKVSYGIGKAEVWAKFFVTHHYGRNDDGVMEHVSTDYFRIDAFGLESAEKISKEDLIGLLEPAKQIDAE